MILLSDEEKERLYQKARAQLVEWYGPDMPECGGCLYWAHATMRVLTEAGLCPILQAGSMQWRCVRPEDDDGVSPTHFSYMWTPNERPSIAARMAGAMMEVHVWAALCDSRCVVDFSTGSFKQLAIKRHKLPWTAPDPPKFLWGKVPECAVYKPDWSAMRYALRLLHN